MKTIYEYIQDLEIPEWHYYFGIDNHFDAKKPFVGGINCPDFIHDYFLQGGKLDVFENSEIRVNELRLPNHICSVYFLGLIFYYNTDLRGKIFPGTNKPGYSTFQFIWFLTALFHDNAYQMEDVNTLNEIDTLPKLFKYFSINHNLFQTPFLHCKNLLAIREKYFLFRRDKYKVVDHGLLGGILLYDRLVKIRRRRKENSHDRLNWEEELEEQYKLAADAISIHNIWLQDKATIDKYNLTEFNNFKKVKLTDFPLFYLLAIVDTLEPIKEFRNNDIEDSIILESICLDFQPNSIEFSKSENCEIDFDRIVKKLNFFDNWINIEIQISEEQNKFKISFI